MGKSIHIRMPRIGRARRISIIFLLVALLPALFYSAYEISTLSSTEKLIESIYTKQLDAVLFSINQYALDVAQNWSSEINSLLLTTRSSRIDSTTLSFLNRREAVAGVFYADSSGRPVSIMVRRSKDGKEDAAPIRLSSLKIERETVEKLMRYASSGYRKIEPVLIGDSLHARGLMLLFVTQSHQPDRRIAGFITDARSFLNDVLQTKLSQTAGEEFLIAVFDRRDHRILFSTSPVDHSELRQTRDLWLFPGYSVGIKLVGTSVDDVVRARSERNLILIGFLDILLLTAAWLMYRALRKEMELVRLKGDFVSNMSHELRTPLALIRMFTETLAMKRVRTEEKKQEYYETILGESERLTRLINKVLNFSRMDAGKREYRLETVALNDVVAGVMKTYTSHIVHEGFEPVILLGENLPEIQADREAVSEAVINLIDNAVKYSTSNRYIRIATGRVNEMVYVEVEDHGIGIERHHHKKIFENFYRVSTGLTHNVKGSGLGLSLVSHIMTAHGGKIELESTPGKGSTFRLLFPVTNRPEPEYKG